MKKIIRKIIMPESTLNAVEGTDVISKRIKNIQSIWHNEHQDDVGIEKLIRLFLAASQFIFPGIYLKHWAGKKGIIYEELMVDLYIFLKMLLPFFILYYNLQEYPILLKVNLWLLIETILYLATLVFASDIFSNPRSYRRSMLLMFLDYFQIVLCFAVLYSSGNYLNHPLNHWFDAIYFSVITSATVGYGDFHPVTAHGKFLVTAQISVFFIVVVLFLNFFTSKLEQKGYFDGSSSQNKKGPSETKGPENF